ncbi:MAG: hypothetical protein KDK10_04180 [Maritimibacter sp.]|nr:hypothetical protein [Maritimibacter sp.]
MSDVRPDISKALEAGESLVWQGHPKPGRPISRRANLIAFLLYSATILLLLIAYFLGIYRGHIETVRLLIYGLIGTAAFLTYMGLKLTLLDRRYARSRDRRTAYAITDRRVLSLAGPYRTEVALGPALSAEIRSGGLDIAAGETRLRLDRLDDAKAVREILLGAIADRT